VWRGPRPFPRYCGGVRALASALAAAFVLTAALPASAGPRPAVRLVDLTPLRIQGTGFRPGERVTLLVTAKKPITKHVVAGQRGGFLTRFWFGIEGCMPVHVQAIGVRGSRAATGIDVAGCDERD